MKPNNVRKWVKALRSGKYKQARGLLAAIEHSKGRPVRYCCLGVGCDAMGLEGVKKRDRLQFLGMETMPPRDFHLWLGVDTVGQIADGDVFLDIPRKHRNGKPIKIFRDRHGHPITAGLAEINDDLKLSFDQIADMIEYFGLTEEWQP